MLAGIAVMCWVTHFALFRSFGLYEDDYFFISPAMQGGLSYVVDRLQVFRTLPQGRPIGFFLPPLFAYLGNAMGGLSAIYVLGFLVVALNCCLAYLLLRRVTPLPVAVAGALGFCLFPADTTRSFLTHDFQLQPSLTFLLLASILYLRGARWRAYVVALGSVFSYESPYLVFAAVPLLCPVWNRRLSRELARHAAIVLALLVLAVVLRGLVGESRVIATESDVRDVLPKVVGSVVLGTERCILLFFYGPFTTVRQWNAIGWAAAVAMGLLAFGLLFLALRVDPSWRVRRPVHVVSHPATRLFLTGLLMIGIGYLLAFTHYPPVAAVGRGTSVHLGATLGASVLVAAAAWWALELAAAFRGAWLGAAVIAAYLGLASGYEMVIQQDFTHAWSLERAFWTQVVSLAPDMGENTLLFYEPDNPNPTRYIDASSWADPLMLAQIFQFPSSWQNPPRLFTVSGDWASRIQQTPQGLQWMVPGATWDEHMEPFPTGNVVVLTGADDHLVRVDSPLQAAGESIPVKPAPSPGAPGHPHDFLYPYVIGTPGS